MTLTAEKNAVQIQMQHQDCSGGKMDFFVRIMVDVFSFFYQSAGNTMLAVILAALGMKAVTISITHSDVYDVQISECIRPLQDAMLTRGTSKDESKNKAQLFVLHKAYGYSAFSGVFSIILQAVIVLHITLMFSSASKYIPDIPGSFWIFPDLYLNIAQTSDFPTIVLCVLLAGANTAIYYLVSKYTSERLIIDVTSLTKAMTAAVLILSFIVPFIVSVYIFFSLLFYTLQGIITIKFLPISKKKLRKLDEKFLETLGNSGRNVRNLRKIIEERPESK